MPLQATSGAASYDGFGGGVAAVPNYIEDVFSTYLYTGTGSAQTITNGIDLSGKGGLVWIKKRSGGTADSHNLYDTDRGATKRIKSNLTDASVTTATSLTSFNLDGFSLGSSTASNESPNPYVSWTFREQPKFFDVVTWTGDGTNGRAISHSLGGTVGCLIVKKTSGTGDWPVWHRSLPAYGANPQSKSTLYLNATLGGDADVYFGSTAPTSTAFYVDVAANASGATYVAYLFAHNAGGFGLTGTDNVISCGSFTTDGSGNATIDLGYEPQWWLEKNSSSGGDNWNLLDIARGQSNSSPTAYLFPNLSNAEASVGAATAIPTATGLNIRSHSATTTYIYIAIRRGPMKVPTSGTSVFSPAIRTGTGSSVSLTSAGFPPDLYLPRRRDTSSGSNYWWDRLRGSSVHLASDNTNAEVSGTRLTSFNQTGVTLGSLDPNASGSSYVDWYLRRAPSFFDEVCYTGTGSPTTFNHNLGVVPELMIVKARTLGTGGYWWVYSASLLASEYLELDGTYAKNTSTTMWNDTRPTSSVFSVGTVTGVNASGNTYVAYLFASCPGVCKVGSYTGTGTTLQVDCGFTGGARFVLIKRTDSTGDWYVWDTARGIISANDPHLSLNTTAAEVTTDDTIDTDSTGFIVNQVTATNVNVSSATYIYLAIA